MNRIFVLVFLSHMIGKRMYIYGFNLVPVMSTTSQPTTILYAQSNFGWHHQHHQNHHHHHPHHMNDNSRISECPYLRAMGFSSSASSLASSSTLQQQQLHRQPRHSTAVQMSDRVIDNYSDFVSKTTTSGHPLMQSSTLIPPSDTIQLNIFEWDQWIWSILDDMYTQSLQMKCPFFRRRTADILDTIDTICRTFVVGQQKQSILPSPASWRPLQQYQKYQYQHQQNSLAIDDTIIEDDQHYSKTINLPLEDIMQLIQNDWHCTTNNKGYYITGRLTKSIYRDDCYFDGPDADMPVRGLRKYLNAASQLFEYKTSTATLLYNCS
jgi:hypothetical protein